jgi:hypothetical protein
VPRLLCAHSAGLPSAAGRSSSTLEGVRSVSTIVPPRPMTRRVLRRPTTRRCAQLSVVLALLACALIFLQSSTVPAYAMWLRLAIYILGASAVVAALAAVIYRLIELPREVTVRVLYRPPVIHFKGRG